jgi:hypothetical protein
MASPNYFSLSSPNEDLSRLGNGERNLPSKGRMAERAGASESLGRGEESNWLLKTPLSKVSLVLLFFGHEDSPPNNQKN